MRSNRKQPTKSVREQPGPSTRARAAPLASTHTPPSAARALEEGEGWDGGGGAGGPCAWPFETRPRTGHRFDLAHRARIHCFVRPGCRPNGSSLFSTEPRWPRALAMFADVARARLRHVPWKRGRRRQCGHRAIISALAGGGLQRGLDARLAASSASATARTVSSASASSAASSSPRVLTWRSKAAVTDDRSLDGGAHPPAISRSSNGAVVAERAAGIGTLRARGRRRRARLRCSSTTELAAARLRCVPILCARRAVVGTAHVGDDGNGAFGGGGGAGRAGDDVQPRAAR